MARATCDCVRGDAPPLFMHTCHAPMVSRSVCPDERRERCFRYTCSVIVEARKFKSIDEACSTCTGTVPVPANNVGMCRDDTSPDYVKQKASTHMLARGAAPRAEIAPPPESEGPSVEDLTLPESAIRDAGIIALISLVQQVQQLRVAVYKRA